MHNSLYINRINNMLYQLDEIMQESPNALSSLESKLKSYLFGNGIVQIQGNSMIIRDNIFANAILRNFSNENYVTEECVEGFNLGRELKKAGRAVGKEVTNLGKAVVDPIKGVIVNEGKNQINEVVGTLSEHLHKNLIETKKQFAKEFKETINEYREAADAITNKVKSNGKELIKNQKRGQKDIFLKAASKMNDVKNNAILYGIAGFILCIIVATYIQGNPFSRIGGAISELVDRIKHKVDEGSLLDNLGDVISDVLKTIGRVISENIIFIAGIVVLIYGIKRYVMEHTKNTAVELINDETETLTNDGKNFIKNILNEIYVQLPEK